MHVQFADGGWLCELETPNGVPANFVRESLLDPVSTMATETNVANVVSCQTLEEHTKSFKVGDKAIGPDGSIWKVKSTFVGLELQDTKDGRLADVTTKNDGVSKALAELKHYGAEDEIKDIDKKMADIMATLIKLAEEKNALKTSP